MRRVCPSPPTAAEAPSQGPAHRADRGTRENVSRSAGTREIHTTAGRWRRVLLAGPRPPSPRRERVSCLRAGVVTAGQQVPGEGAGPRGNGPRFPQLRSTFVDKELEVPTRAPKTGSGKARREGCAPRDAHGVPGM